MLEQERRHRHWFESAFEITRLLRHDIDQPAAMRLVAERVRALSGAAYTAIEVVDPSDPASVVCEAVSGLGLDHYSGARLAREGITAAVLDTGDPRFVEAVARDDWPASIAADWSEALSTLGRAVCVPLRGPGEVYGTLVAGWQEYSAGADPGAGEIALLQMVADQAALLLGKARAQSTRVRHERWIEGTSEMARLLLSKVDRDDAMRVVAQQLRGLSGADFVGVTLLDPTDADQAFVVVFEGLDVAISPDRRVPREDLVRRVVESRQRLVSTDWTHQAGYQPPAEWAEALLTIGLGMLVPLVVDDEVFGVLFAAWRRGSPHEQAAANEAGQVQTFADLAAIALQRVRAQGDREHLILLKERNRIALELNDAVIQRLFAAGLSLESARGLCAQDQVRQRITTTIADLDETNREIRSAIFKVRPDGADD
ncbi:GAF domain-containing protein [Actinopolymorpha sp. B17G11]|uniref:GAF domain-containing protein n=1 Tax=Actinopolymorpha sp. B17G11 TaxID=3160861 RepID=UPI0032E3C469